MLFGQLFEAGESNWRTFIFHEENRLFREARQKFGHQIHSAAVQFDLSKFPLQIGRLGGKVAAPVHDETNHRPFDRQKGFGVGQED